MVRHDGTSPHPVAQTPKSGYISSKEELINDYLDHFEGIWEISWNLQDTPKKPGNSSPAKMANCNALKAEDKLNQME